MEHSKENNERVKRRIRRRRIKLCLIAGLVSFAIAFSVIACSNMKSGNNPTPPDNGQSQDGGDTSGGSTENSNILASATIVSTGDILIHDNVLGGAKTASGGYDFSGMFPYIKNYFSAADYMVAKL